MKVNGKRIHPSTDCVTGQFAVVGHHKQIGSGILFWTESKEAAEYNAKIINENGGEAKVTTKKEALVA